MFTDKKKNIRQIFVRTFAIDLVERHESEFPFGMKSKFYFFVFMTSVFTILVTNKAVITPLMLTYRYISYSAIRTYNYFNYLHSKISNPFPIFTFAFWQSGKGIFRLWWIYCFIYDQGVTILYFRINALETSFYKNL